VSNFLCYLRDDAELVRPLGTLTVSSETSLYPASNMKIMPVAKPWRTAEGQIGDQYIRVDFPSAQTIDTVAIVGNNLTSEAVVYLNGGTTPDPDGSEFTHVIAPEPRTAWARFTEQSFRYWKIVIDDPTNTAGFLKVGRLMLGLSTQLDVGFVNGEVFDYEVLERSFITEFGVPQIGEPISERIRFRCDFLEITRAEAEALRRWLFALRGARNPLLVIPNPLYQPAFFGRFSGRLSVSGDSRTEAADNVPEVEFTEDHAGLVVEEPLFVAEDGDISEWDAGDPLGNFDRDSIAHYKDASLVLSPSPSDTARQSHYVESGVAGLLIEPGSTNAFDYSDDLDAWVAADANSLYNAASSDPDNAIAPNGTAASADKLVEDSGSGPHEVRLAAPDVLSDDTPQAFSVFLKADERSVAEVLVLDKSSASGALVLNLSTGSFIDLPSIFIQAEAEEYASGWWRLKFSFDSSNGGTGVVVDIRLHNGTTSSYTGDGSSGFHIWGWQWEIDKPWPTSYIASAGSAGSRTVELAWLTATFAPQPISAYLRYVEIGQIHATGSDLALLLMGNATGGRVQLSQVALPRMLHDNTSSTVNSATTGANAKGDIVELLGVVRSDGSVQIIRRTNGGTAQVIAQSAALTLPPAWGAPGPLRLGHVLSGSPAGVVIQRVKVVKGVNTDIDSLAV
jgi:hypothetical protein